MTDPLPLFIVLAAILLGIMIFGGLLLLGVVAIRRLRLPTDLPEAARYEPLPPTMVAHATKTEAQAAAAARNTLATLLTQAHAAVRDALHCQEQRHACAPLVDDPAHAATIADITAATDEAIHAAETADAHAQRLRLANAPMADDDAARTAIPALALQAAAARARVDAAIARLPDSGNRRLWIMLIALAVLIAWVVAMKVLLPH